MNQFKFFRYFLPIFALTFSFLIKTAYPMQDSEFENISSGFEEISKNYAPSEEIIQNRQEQLDFEFLPWEIKFLILQHLILGLKDFDSALNNIISFAKTSKENKAIVEKNAKPLICHLLRKVNCSSICKNIFSKRFPKIFVKGLFKIFLDEDILNKLANSFEINVENLRFFILFMAAITNDLKFFKLLFNEENYIDEIPKETIYDIIKIAVIANNEDLIEFFLNKGYKVPSSELFERKALHKVR